MIDVTEIRSLTEFKRHTAEFLDRLRASGRPQVLTINGRAELVVQDAKAYQELMDIVERASALEGIRRGLDDMAAGRTQPAKVALADVRRRLRAPKNA